jgi:hypothetical protein
MDTGDPAELLASPITLDSAPGSRIGNWIALLVVVGASLRLLQYAINRSLWMDEALLAGNFDGHPFSVLLGPLPYGQTAPLGFLTLEWLAAAVLGSHEVVLRLAPLIAGLAAVLIFVPLARRYLDAPAAAIAIGLFALSPFLVYYASELKQYSFDVLATCVVLYLAKNVEDHGTRSRELLWLGVAGVLVVWFSQTSIFILAGVGSVLAIRAWRRSARDLVPLAAWGVAWLVSFAGSYAIARRGVDSEYMRDFWASGFPPLLPRTVEEWLWLPLTVARVFRDPLGIPADDARFSYPMMVGGLIAFTIGAAWLLSRRRTAGALLLAPLPFVLLAAAVQAYPLGADRPLGGRVLLYLVPILLLVIAAGVHQAQRRFAPAGYLLLALVFAPSLMYAATGVPQVRQEMKPLLGYLQENWQNGDRFYVYYQAVPAFEYYAARYGVDPASSVLGICSRMEPAGYLADIERLRGQGRVWVLFTGGDGAHRFDEKRLILDYLSVAATRLDDQVSHGAGLYLYDLSGPAPTQRFRIAPLPPSIEGECRGPWVRG